jgi:signal transduction histidine kinase
MTGAQAQSHRRFLVMVFVGLISWLLLVGGSLGWNLHRQDQQLIAQAKRAAEVTLNKDVNFRRWIRSHGGVYVPVTEETPPNIWLSHVPHRDVKIGDRNFTLINSSYAIRQVMESTGQQQGVSSRVTSLQPLRPQNSADGWERQQLESFEKSLERGTHFELVSSHNGDRLLRGMRPFYIKEGCLACHGHQGYAVGDLRGAMSVRVDLGVFNRDEPSVVPVLVLGHLLIALAGLAGLAGLYRYGRAAQRAQQALIGFSAQLKRRVDEEVNARRNHEGLLIQQSKMATMGEMIGAIAHQWRQPLNALAITIQDLRDAYRHGELTGSYMDESVQRSMGQIGFMSRTIDDFRNFFRPEAQRRPFALQENIQEAVGLLSAQFRSHDITLSMTMPDTPLICQGFGNQLKQALLNILINAKDAIEERGVASGQVQIVLRRQDMRAQISICDNGGGIDPGFWDRIFEPYATTKSGEKGTGIGLYMARMIIEESFGGTLKGHNRGEGACFEIELGIEA